MKTTSLLSFLRTDLLAGIVVFLVALPLCLGIANASGVAPISGIISGIIGGVIVATFSGSAISVSGPAAGLIVIVIGAIAQLGSFSAFLTSVSLAGLLQVVFGLLKAGRFAAYIPSSVIKGMLAAIGILLIVSQIPLALGIDLGAPEHVGEIQSLIGSISPAAIILTLISLAILFAWDAQALRKMAFTRAFSAPLVVVALGIITTFFLDFAAPHLAPPSEHRVDLPALGSLNDLFSAMTPPALDQIGRMDVWVVAITLALVASLESLLSLEAMEQMDPYKRSASPNRELTAQGIGNLLAGAFGGLPITSVIVRSSANMHAGARSKVSAIFHGMLLLLCMFFLADTLNLIPLACLAAILLYTGFKLAKPSMFIATAKQGAYYFIPFAATILGVIGIDLLMGILIGFGTCVVLTIVANLRNTFSFAHYENHYLLVFRKDVSFLGKVSLKRHLLSIVADSSLLIDANHVDYIDPDVMDLIRDFVRDAEQKNITISWRNLRSGSLSSADPLISAALGNTP